MILSALVSQSRPDSRHHIAWDDSTVTVQTMHKRMWKSTDKCRSNARVLIEFRLAGAVHQVPVGK